MIRILGAFAWLRWRLLANSFRNLGRRDSLERFARGASTLVPILLWLLFVPALIGSGALGILGGWLIGSGGHAARAVLILARVILAAITLGVVLAPAMRSIRGNPSGLSRFVLLPIPAGLLYVSDLASGLLDPWIALPVPFLLLLPVGLAASGAYLAAGVALIAGIAMAGTLLSLECAVSCFLRLLYRNRRRGEVVTLIVLVTLSFSGLVPLLLSSREQEGEPRQTAAKSSQAVAGSPAQGGPPPSSTTAPTAGSDGSPAPAGPSRSPASPPSEGIDRGPEQTEPPPRTADSPRVDIGRDRTSSPQHEGRRPQPADGRSDRGRDRALVLRIPRWLGFIPSELYSKTLSGTAGGMPASAPIALGGLALIGIGLVGASWIAYRRLLESPEGGSSRRSAQGAAPFTARLPGMNMAASALALAHLRLVLRTVQGKMAVYFTPVSMLAVFAILMRVGGSESMIPRLGEHAGPMIALGGMAVSLLSMQKMMLNQFAIDGPGLTLQLLSPASEREMVMGKAAAMGILFAGPSAVYLIAAAIFAPDRAILLWPAAALAGASAFLLFAPAAALLSALFPKPANLNQAGSAGNPNQLAALLGMFVVTIAFLPPLALGALAIVVYKSAVWALVLLGIWAILAGGAFFPLMGICAHVVAERRENLALVARGR